MFLHNFKYSLKILIRNKALLFWTFLFPLVLGLFFKMAFSNIEKQETFKVIDIAIIDNDAFRNDLVYKEVFKDLGNKNSNNYMFNIKYLNELDARKLLSEKKISAYIDFNKEDLVVNQSGVNETIVLNVINKINTNKKIINDLIQENNYLEINNIIYLKTLNTYLRSDEFKSLENLLSFKNALLLSLNLGLIDNTSFSLDELSLIFKISRDNLENILKESLSILNTKKMK